MNQKNIYWIIAGVINLFTALLHTIGGQLSLVNPLLDSGLSAQVRAEWLGAWHMVTIFLFVTSYYILKKGLNVSAKISRETMKLIGILYILMSIPSIISSLYLKVFAPQWVILLPIGVLVYIGLRKSKSLAQL